MLELIFQLKCFAHVQEGLDTHKHMHMHLNECELLIKVCAKLYVRAENMNYNGDRDVCALVSIPPALVSEQNVGREVH